MCTKCGNGSGDSDAVTDHSIDHQFELEPDTDYLCTCGRHVSAHPDKFEFLKKHEMDTIIKNGHQVRYIMADDDHESFAYSVGRTVRDRPELLVTGPLDPQTLMVMINEAAAYDDQHGLEPGEYPAATLLACPIRVVTVPDLEVAQMYGVTNQFGTDDTSALQIVWPDAQDRWPDNPEFEYGDVQRVFG